MKSLYYFVIAAMVVVLDQMTKYWALHAFLPNTFSSMTDFLNVGLWFNTGAAFSFLNEAGGWQRWFLIGLAILISLFLIGAIWRLKDNEKQQGIGFALILGGAIGNVWDRITLGVVVDFLDFHWENMHWPAFNVADSAICIGTFLLVIAFLSKSEGIMRV